MATGELLALAVEAFISKLPEYSEKAVRKISGEAKVALAIRSLKVDRNSLASRLSVHRHVRTVLQPMLSTDILNIYVPLNGEILSPNSSAGKTRIVEPSDPTVVVQHKKIIVYGIAGQGKSVVMRKLAVTFLDEKRLQLPLFVELRKLGPEMSLEDLLIKELEELGISGGGDTLRGMAAAGALALFLDGFDEMSLTAQATFLEQFKTFDRVVDPGIVVISTRPGTNVFGLANFAILEILDLSADQLINTIERLCVACVQNPSPLLERIKSAPTEIAEIARTPLLATLLVATYQATAEIPRKLSDFYSQIFYVMYHLHDSYKLNVKRHINQPLGSEQAKQVFNAFCYECDDLAAGSKGDFVRKMSQALPDLRLPDGHSSVDPEGFFDDIVNRTCLLVEEGRRFEFIHKTLVEYHAALHFANLPDVAQTEKLSTWIEHRSWRSARSFLGFYAEIDPSRFEALFLIPLMDRMLVYLRPKNLSSIQGLTSTCNELGLRYDNGDTGVVWETLFSRPCSLGASIAIDLWNETRMRRWIRPPDFEESFPSDAIRRELVRLAEGLRERRERLVQRMSSRWRALSIRDDSDARRGLGIPPRPSESGG